MAASDVKTVRKVQVDPTVALESLHDTQFLSEKWQGTVADRRDMAILGRTQELRVRPLTIY